MILICHLMFHLSFLNSWWDLYRRMPLWLQSNILAHFASRLAGLESYLSISLPPSRWWLGTCGFEGKLNFTQAPKWVVLPFLKGSGHRPDHTPLNGRSVISSRRSSSDPLSERRDSSVGWNYHGKNLRLSLQLHCLATRCRFEVTFNTGACLIFELCF